MGFPLVKSLPRELTSRSEPVTRIICNPSSPQKLILGAHGFFCHVDLHQPVPDKANMFPPDHLRAKRIQMPNSEDNSMHSLRRQEKQKMANRGSNSNFTICLRYDTVVERLGGLARCSISKSIWNIRSVMGAIPRELQCGAVAFGGTSPVIQSIDSELLHTTISNTDETQTIGTSCGQIVVRDKRSATKQTSRQLASRCIHDDEINVIA
eukprot:scaffold5403_cov198-Skeletonema_marinoi.AAC.4